MTRARTIVATHGWFRYQTCALMRTCPRLDETYCRTDKTAFVQVLQQSKNSIVDSTAAMVAKVPCNLTPRHPPSQVVDNLPRYGG